MKLNIDKNLLDKMISEKYISVQKHPTADLFIYNYTHKAQFDKVWNEATMTCRGLILDSNYEIIERPFKKFFNLSEHTDRLPTDKPKIWDKADGSLGILHWVDDIPYIATRGSFTSEQAIEATKMLHENKDIWGYFNKDNTYLFEIIYPENKICIDYGNERKLIHLATINKETGKSLPINDSPFETVTYFKELSLNNLPQEKNKEGYVLEWDNGLRLKVKNDEYLRLHKLLTNVTARSIWELLSSNQNINELMENVPDEFYDFVRKTRDSLLDDFRRIYLSVIQHYKSAKGLPTRKRQAESLENYEYKAIVFKILDKKQYEQDIWKLIYPPHIKPFKQEI